MDRIRIARELVRIAEELAGADGMWNGSTHCDQCDRKISGYLYDTVNYKGDHCVMCKSCFDRCQHGLGDHAGQEYVEIGDGKFKYNRGDARGDMRLRPYKDRQEGSDGGFLGRIKEIVDGLRLMDNADRSEIVGSHDGGSYLVYSGWRKFNGKGISRLDINVSESKDGKYNVDAKGCSWFGSSLRGESFSLSRHGVKGETAVSIIGRYDFSGKLSACEKKAYGKHLKRDRYDDFLSHSEYLEMDENGEDLLDLMNGSEDIPVRF